MTAYYNEHDPFAAAWLRELIRAGAIAPGDVDERSIEDVRPDELAGYTQCHFFAGIGVWSYVLRLAGWPDDQPAWTGSCPCQPFSSAGKGGGFADERHLWPAWFHLIEQCRPGIVFGEQSARATDWLFLVRSDLEALDYAVAAIPMEAASAGAFMLRDRLWFVADAGRTGLAERKSDRAVLRDLASESKRKDAANAPSNGFAFFLGPDGKRRPFESSIQPLAHGAAARVGRLRGYGNAINAEAARAFIEAYRGI